MWLSFLLINVGILILNFCIFEKNLEIEREFERALKEANEDREGFLLATRQWRDEVRLAVGKFKNEQTN